LARLGRYFLIIVAKRYARGKKWNAMHKKTNQKDLKVTTLERETTVFIDSSIDGK
jgi:hypothetical protein